MADYTRLQLRSFQTSSEDWSAETPCTLINNNSSTAYFAMEGERYWDGNRFNYKDIFNSASLSNLVNCSVVSGSTNAGFIVNPMATASFDLTPSSTIPKALVKFSAPNAIVYSLGDTTASGSLLGVTFSLGSAVSYLLDDYGGAAAAYSLRRLNSAYTGPAIKVQDNVGGTTQDIGFGSNGELDTTALAAYGGSNDVFVETWYDQSGNGNNITQTSSANRPKIYDGATAAVLTQNGKPTVDFRGSATVSLSNASFKLNPTPFSMFTVAQFPNTSDVQALVDQSEGTTAGLLFRKNGGTNEFRFWYYPDLSSKVLGVDNSTAQSLRTLMLANGEQLYRLDGTQEYSAGTAITNNPVPTYDFVIGRDQDRADRYFQGNAQELIFYLSNEKNNFTDIEDNINTFYNIYP